MDIENKIKSKLCLKSFKKGGINIKTLRDYASKLINIRKNNKLKTKKELCNELYNELSKKLTNKKINFRRSKKKYKNCNFDSNKPCSSKTRKRGRYTKKELVNIYSKCFPDLLLKNIKKLKMDKICNDLHHIQLINKKSTKSRKIQKKFKKQNFKTIQDKINVINEEIAIYSKEIQDIIKNLGKVTQSERKKLIKKMQSNMKERNILTDSKSKYKNQLKLLSKKNIYKNLVDCSNIDEDKVPDPITQKDLNSEQIIIKDNIVKLGKKTPYHCFHPQSLYDMWTKEVKNKGKTSIKLKNPLTNKLLSNKDYDLILEKMNRINKKKIDKPQPIKLIKLEPYYKINYSPYLISFDIKKNNIYQNPNKNRYYNPNNLSVLEKLQYKNWFQLKLILNI